MPETQRHPNMKVSIAIPCHNAERWIREAVDSALNQDWKDIEVLVWDDGSTDGSSKILRGYGDRIRLLGGYSVGSNAARNRLLETSTGKWIQFLDADDYLKPDKISKQLDESGREHEVLFSPIIEETWKGDSLQTTRISQLDERIDNMTHWLSWHVCQTGAALWRRRSIVHIGGWNEAQPCCQDNEIMLRAQQAGLNLKLTPTARAVYRLWSDDTLCHRNPMMTLLEKTRLIDQALAWLGETKQLTSAHIAAAEEVFYATSRTLAKTDRKAANRYLKERQKRGLGKPHPTAATPRSYCLAFKCFGFNGAEQLASTARLLANRA